jgi:hypothetical protein
MGIVAPTIGMPGAALRSALMGLAASAMITAGFKRVSKDSVAGSAPGVTPYSNLRQTT